MISVEADVEAGMAYLQLGDLPVARTDEYSDVLNVDLDGRGAAVGIELLDLATAIPVDDLVARYGIDRWTLERLIDDLDVQRRGQSSTPPQPST